MRRHEAALSRAWAAALGAWTFAPQVAAPEPWVRVFGGPPALRCEGHAVLHAGPWLRDLDDAWRGAVFATEGGRVWVALVERDWFDGVLSRLLPGDGAARGDGLDAVAEGALTALALEGARWVASPAPAPRFRAVTDSAAVALDALGVTPRLSRQLVVSTWQVALGDLVGRVKLCALADEALPHAVPRRVAPDARFSRTAVRVRLEAGRACWPASALAELGVGRCLRLDRWRLDGGQLSGPVSLWLGASALPRVALAGRVDAGWRVTVTGVETVGGMMGSDKAHDDATLLDGEALGAVGVEVSVELASQSFSLAEVAAWRVGSVLEWDALISAQVTLRAGGVAIAEGALVDVEGRVGVQLTRVFGTRG